MKIFNKQQGQTLVEMLVVLFIISLGVMSLISLLISNVRTAEESENILVANNLARECIEVVRNIRDTNWLKGNDFEIGLVGPGLDYTGAIYYNFGDIYNIYFGADELDPDPANEARVYIDQNVYFQSILIPGTAVESRFKRLVTLDRICRNKATGVENLKSTGFTCDAVTEDLAGINVVCEVQWEYQGVTKSIQLVDRLYNWR